MNAIDEYAQITVLKAQVFDALVQIEQHQIAVQQLNQRKQQLCQQIAQLQQQQTEAKAGDLPDDKIPEA